MTTQANTRTHSVVTIPGDNRPQDVPSIREICLRSIMTGDLTKQQAQDLIAQHHPEAAGSKKFNTHYSWYKGWLAKKASEKDIAGLKKRFGIVDAVEETSDTE